MFDPEQSALFREIFGFDPETVKLARENEWWDLVDDDGNQIELPDEVQGEQPPLF